MKENVAFMRIRYLLLSAFLAAGLVACRGADSEKTELLVYAAASLRDVAADLAAEFERRHPVEVIYNFAGSNTLAQQIRAAPGADVFLSADEIWVDALVQAGRTVEGTRRTFLGNSLVLVVHRDSRLEIEDPRDLATAVAAVDGPDNDESGDGIRFLALADPEAVPAGRYARAALERMLLPTRPPAASASLWARLADKVAPTLDVRAALALVESDPAIAGIIYKTDAMTSDRVRVLFEIPTDDTPIRYGAALIAGGEAPEMGRRFLEFLARPKALEIAEQHGFSASEPPEQGRRSEPPR